MQRRKEASEDRKKKGREQGTNGMERKNGQNDERKDAKKEGSVTLLKRKM